MLSISLNAKTILADATAPPPQPAAPQRPPVPQTQEKLSPEKDKTYIAVGRDGQIWGSGPDGSLVISGRLDSGTGKDGKGTGSIVAR
jgi:hypothetical protein